VHALATPAYHPPELADQSGEAAPFEMVMEHPSESESEYEHESESESELATMVCPHRALIVQPSVENHAAAEKDRVASKRITFRSQLALIA
jgi:hypothetical protein